jgi:hypothetical protein
MQEIANTQQNQLTQWSEPSLPAKLNDLLMGDDLPTIGPKSAAILQQYVDAPRPPMPEREQVEVMIAKLALATASQKRSQDEEAERLELYWMTLRIWPLVDLRSAFLKLLRTCKFMPTPAEIDSVVDEEGRDRRRRLARAEYLLMIHRRDYTPPKEYVTAEELAALNAELTQSLKTKEGIN